MKLSQKQLAAIAEFGWRPERIKRFLKRADRIAMKMMKEAEGELSNVGEKDGHPLTIRTSAFRTAVDGMKTAIAAAEHMAKITVLLESTQTEAPTATDSREIHIHPTPAAVDRMADED